MTQTEPATRAALYVRVSSEEQASGGTSLETQEQRCRAYCAAQGWDVQDVYVDAGISGAKTEEDRDALKALLSAVAGGQVDTIVVAKLDRLYRSMRHLAPLLGALDDQGVALVSIAESFDSASPSGRLMRTILGGFAEHERDVISERTTAGRLARLREGGWTGGEAPLGFRVDRTDGRAVLALHDAEVAMVRRAVGLLLDRGLTTGEAARVLNAEGYRPRRAPVWTAALLRNHLMRGPWGGTWTYAKPSKRTKTEPVTIAVPRILDAERHAALLLYLRTTTSPKTRTVVHPLSGLLVGECGHTYSGVARGDRGRRRYRCRFMTEAGRGWRCDAPTILADPLDDAVWGEVVALLADPTRLLSAAAERLGLLDSAQAVEADALERAEVEVSRLERSLGEVFAQGVRVGLDEAALREATASLEASLVEARQHAAMVAAMRAETAQERGRLDRVRLLADLAGERLVTADAALRARVLALLGVQVRVPVLGAEGQPVRVEVSGTVAHDVLLGSLAPAEHGALSLLKRTSR
jgi:site-specific DNA recombinase